MTDRFRRTYVTLTPHNKATVERIKDDAARLAENLELLDSSRDLALALTKLEEAVFWATKHYTAPERQG
jgi:DNA-binding MarR family transcriptional regulator